MFVYCNYMDNDVDHMENQSFYKKIKAFSDGVSRLLTTYYFSGLLQKTNSSKAF